MSFNQDACNDDGLFKLLNTAASEVDVILVIRRYSMCDMKKNSIPQEFELIE